MIFSVYVLRKDPNVVVFDVELGKRDWPLKSEKGAGGKWLSPPGTERLRGPADGTLREDYDLAGVYRIDDEQAFFCRHEQSDSGVELRTLAHLWSFRAHDILSGRFTDANTGETAPIVLLFSC